jgi:hypothetical protein
MTDNVFDIALEKRFTDSAEVVTINVTSADTLLLRDAETGSVMKLPFSTLASAISSAFANSFASLVDGKVPAAQLPSYVDDVLEYSDTSSFPATGESGKIYVALDSNRTYRWSGSGYTEISASLALGETSSTAYRGDRGKSAYDHSQLTGNPHSTTKSDLGATTVGSNLFTLANPSAIRFLRVNADNTVSPLTDSDFRTAIGAAPTDIVPDRIADDVGCLRISNPGGAAANLYNAALTGAIKIALPIAAYNSSTILSFTVDICNYATGTARRIRCGGYNYNGGSWINVFATQDTAEGAALNVRFGHDGTRNCVWIGETDTVWAWANVGVTDFQAGFQQFTEANWASGWAITGGITAFDTVQAMVRVGKSMRLVPVPSTATSSGTVGEFAIDANYIYVCTAVNTWKRSQLLTW